ncbi:MAG: NAD(P)-dependent oxidoreductase, partial [Candidatus Solibacter sp.]|nr:NAD(P)-dependent oxidoreductase [Candidatus Solibacter sp.]
ERVVKAGFATFTTFHHRREPADTLVAMGATLLDSPAQVARAADTIITILPADAELKETVFGVGGLREGFSPGKVLIDMTTATALTLQEVAAALTPMGVRVLDAPVSGGTTGAANGTLTIMVGGDASLLEECRPLLESMGSRIIHAGPLGQGKIVKIVNQMMAAVNLLAIGEAFAFGIRSGADPDTLYSVIKESSGYSKMMDLRLPGFLLAGSFQPGFKLDLMKKDVNLALDSARAQRIPLLLTATASQVFAAASMAGKGSADFSAAAQFLADLAGVQLSRPEAREGATGAVGT